MKKIFLLLTFLMVFAFMGLAGPADGTWVLSGTAANAPQTIVLQVSGSGLSGTADGVVITGAGISGNEVWFRVAKNGTATYFKGSISGTQMKLYPDKGATGPIVYNHQ